MADQNAIITQVPLKLHDNGDGTVSLVAYIPAGTNALGGVIATGDVASGAADGTSKPVKVGGVYVAAGITLANLQRGDLQMDQYGNVKATLGTDLAGENRAYLRMMTLPAYSALNITTATTTVVKAAAGFLHAIVVNTTAAGTITIYDNSAASGTKLGTLKASIAEGTYTFNAQTATGLTIVTAGASDITVMWL